MKKKTSMFKNQNPASQQPSDINNKLKTTIKHDQ